MPPPGGAHQSNHRETRLNNNIAARSRTARGSGRGRILLLLASAVLQAACTSPLPAVQWLRLPISPPQAGAPVAQPSGVVWQLMQPVLLPGHLERDALLVPQGPAGLQALGGWRWAEPLRDSVPRLLREDLASLLGPGRVWTAPLPSGVVVTRQLRVELSALDVEPGGRGVRLRARWTLADPRNLVQPSVEAVDFSVASSGADAQALAVAHRLALWQLALRIAATPAPG